MTQTNEQIIEYEIVAEDKTKDEIEQLKSKLYENDVLKQPLSSSPTYKPANAKEQEALYDSDLYVYHTNAWKRYPNANNVLTKDNTTAFTPDANYEPATKKYVDDSIVSNNEANFEVALTNSDLETIAANKVVVMRSGNAYLGDAADSQYITYVGIAKEGIAESESGQVVVHGIVGGFTGLTAGSKYYLQDATTSKEQYQETAQTTVSVEEGTTYWQSFTTGAGVTNLSKFSLYVSTGTPTGGTWAVKIRSGEGTAGSVLWEGNVNLTAGSDPLWHDIIPTNIIDVSPETQYTITVAHVSLARAWWRSNSSVYAGGKSSVGDNYDFCFRTYTRTDRGEIDTTEGSNSVLVGKALTTTKLLIIND